MEVVSPVHTIITCIRISAILTLLAVSSIPLIVRGTLFVVLVTLLFRGMMGLGDVF